ncbi:hypothetical protein [Stieleria varia]|uniref:Uncharacterized protein n=1 Tax=Stieleria varia TaxID=2528005 RepID=A0A5C5ZVS7_9BACT|nr:hypothetical protein [Stieleria varia]TWT91158.1 hypothetical protein Pla52n_67000 [Stieleria varia]
MFRRVFVAAVVAVMAFTFASDAEAGGWRFRRYAAYHPVAVPVPTAAYYAPAPAVEVHSYYAPAPVVRVEAYRVAPVLPYRPVFAPPVVVARPAYYIGW